MYLDIHVVDRGLLVELVVHGLALMLEEVCADVDLVYAELDYTTDVLLASTGTAVKNQRHLQSFLELGQAIEIEMGNGSRRDRRRSAGPIATRKAVASGALHEFTGLLDVGVHIGATSIARCRLTNVSEFGLNRHAVGMSEGDDLTHAANVLLEVIARSVDHDAGESRLDAADDILVLATMVEIERHGHIEGLGDGADHGDHDLGRGVSLHLTGRDVDDDRRGWAAAA